MLEFVLGAVAAAIVIWLLSRRRAAEPQSNLVMRAEASVKSYDPEKYQFDGLARPEFRIEYADEDGIVTARDIYVHRVRTKDNIHYLQSWCFLRDERRTFRSDRILSAINLDTNRKVKDIAAYLSR